MRTKATARDQWDNLRPIVEYLYLDQGLKLDQVKAIIEDEYGFVAT